MILLWSSRTFTKRLPASRLHCPRMSLPGTKHFGRDTSSNFKILLSHKAIPFLSRASLYDICHPCWYCILIGCNPAVKPLTK